MRKNLPYIKLQMAGVFLSHLDQFVNLIKMHGKIFFTKNVDFYIFEPQKCKMNENYPETPNQVKIYSILLVP